MKIEFLHRDEIDDALWDACINKALNSLIYGYSWYLDEVCDDWDALVYDDYKAVMPLPHRRKWGFTYCYQPFFCQQLGVFSTTETGEALLKAFFSALPAHYTLFDMQLNVFSKPLDGLGKLRTRTNYRLPLIPVYEKIASGYNNNTKRNIKKAEANKMAAFENADPFSVIALYKRHYADKTPEINDAAYDRLTRLVSKAIKMGAVQAWGVYDEHNTLCGGAIFLTDHKNLYYLLGGADDAGRYNGALHTLFDALIKRYAGLDLVLDFEGSDIEGIARFYAGLGAKPLSYYHLRINRLPWWLKLFKK